MLKCVSGYMERPVGVARTGVVGRLKSLSFCLSLESCVPLPRREKMHRRSPPSEDIRRSLLLRLLLRNAPVLSFYLHSKEEAEIYIYRVDRAHSLRSSENYIASCLARCGVCVRVDKIFYFI